MGWIKPCAVLLGLAIGSKALHLFFKMFKLQTYTNKVLVFSDICPECLQPNKKTIPPRQCCLRRVAVIERCVDSARISMDLCMYIVTCPRLSAAVLRAHKRGVSVRLIVDSEMAFASNSSVLAFHDAGIPIRWKKSTSLMHHKFCLIDHPIRVSQLNRQANSPGLLLIGSLNWTVQAWRGNWENMVLTSQPELTEAAQRTFIRLWIAFKDFEPCGFVP